jgi:hypothetical protein
MAKWADYLISAVRYTESNNKNYISQLKVHSDNDDNVSEASTWTKQDVINKIDNNFSFKTIYKNKENQWSKGEDVKKIKIGINYYLRTDSNNTPKDNLENLPEF